jgi:ferritin-like metal-binding protein YciE
MCAARRSDVLFDLTGKNLSMDGPLKETAMTPISKDEARNFFVLGLKNIHATATQCRRMVEAQMNRVENYPIVRAKLHKHLAEKDAQLERVREILGALGERPSSLKDTGMSLMGTLSSMGASMADDEIIKSSFAMYGLANFEAAAYETLLLFGEAAGEYGAIKLLQQSLSEERAMAAFIADNLRGTGMRFLQLRTEGARASH